MRLGMRHMIGSLALVSALAITLPAHAQLDTETLMRAVELNNIERIRNALARGADPDTSDEHGNTLLAVAAAEGHVELAKFLIAQRARVNNRNAYGDTPLMVAAYHGQLEMARQLIAAGAEVNTEGWTPLHYCAWRGHADVCTLLIDLRARLNVRSPNGSTPLMMAVREGRANTVKLLLAHRASTELKNDDDATALSWAIRDNRRDMIELLKQAGATQ